MISAASRIRPRIRIFRKLSIWTWSRPLFSTPRIEETDDGVADAAAAAEQAGAAHHDGGDGIEQVAVELVLLGAAEMGHAQHAGDTRAHRRDDDDGTEHQLDVDAGILGRLAVAADHVHAAAEARVGQHQVPGQQESRRHQHEARHAGHPARPRKERRSGTA